MMTTDMSQHLYTHPRTTRKGVHLVTIRSQVAAAVVAITVVLFAPTVAFGAPAAAETQPREYNLDFTLPTAGVSGCTVCHGDPNLVRVGEITTRSIFVDMDVLADSAHKDVPCTGCHIDFAFKTPHDNIVKAGEQWREVAKQACKNCHEQQFSYYAAGAHSPAVRPGEDTEARAVARTAEGKPVDKPYCGDCHGSHNIPRMDDAAGMAAFRADGVRICGQCHVNEADAYADYYHGAAYRTGASDSPNCWDCHDDHRVLPADDRNSPVHPSQLVLTCSAEDACHTNVGEDFLDYAPMIHRKSEIKETVPLWALIDSIRGVIRSIGAWFG
jgi:hypothetical protein